MNESPARSDDVLVPLRAPYIDERGEILNLLDLDIGSVSVIKSATGSVRANHYHKTDDHYCWLESGTVRYYHRPVGDTKPPQMWEIGPGVLFYTPPMYEHAMHFREESVMYVFARNRRDQENYEADTVRVAPIVQKDEDG